MEYVEYMISLNIFQVSAQCVAIDIEKKYIYICMVDFGKSDQMIKIIFRSLFTELLQIKHFLSFLPFSNLRK